MGLLSALYWTMCPETPLIVTWGGPEAILSDEDLLEEAEAAAMFESKRPPHGPLDIDWSQHVNSLWKRKKWEEIVFRTFVWNNLTIWEFDLVPSTIWFFVGYQKSFFFFCFFSFVTTQVQKSRILVSRRGCTIKNSDRKFSSTDFYKLGH